MACRFSTTFQYLKRVAAGYTTDGAFTLCGWVYWVSVLSSWQYFMGFDNGSSYTIMGCTNGGSFHWSSPGGTIDPGVVPTAATWYFVAMSYPGGGATGTGKLYRAVEGAGSLTPTTGTVTGMNSGWDLYLGNNGFGEYSNVRLAAMKGWNVQLSDSELLAEMNTYNPVKTSGLVEWHPLVHGPDLPDWSGNGRTLTLGSTPQFENNPRLLEFTVDAPPFVRAAAQQTTINGVSITVAQLTEKRAGDLLLVSADYDATASATDVSTASSGWVKDRQDTQGTNVLRTTKFKKLATTNGNSGDALIVTGPGQDAVYTTHIIGNHAVANVNTDFAWSVAPASGSTGQADPPASGTIASKKWLWLAQCVHDFTATTTVMTAGPSGYTGVMLSKSAASTTSCGVASAVKQALTAATAENPGAFTCSLSTRPWLAYTGFIAPAVVGAAKLYVGANDVDDLKFGASDVSAVYMGTTQVWP